MTQHSQRAQTGPEVRSLVLGWSTTAAALAGSVYIQTGPGGWRSVVGSSMGLAWMFMTAGITMNMHIERVVARQRIERERERVERQAEKAEAVRAGTIATWTGEHPGQRFSVRYDATTGYLMVQGWMGDHFQVPREAPWFNVASLKDTIVELEATHELEPETGPGMDAVRQRLGLLTSPSALRAVNVPVMRGEPVTEEMPRVR